MPNYLITVRDDCKELECTTFFEDADEEAAKRQSIEYYARELERPTEVFTIVSVYLILL